MTNKNKIHNKAQQPPRYNNYTSVPMNLSSDFYYGKNKTKYKSSSTNCSSSFLQYLFSDKSILTRLLVSLVPPFGSFTVIQTDYDGSLLNILLLVIVLYERVWKDSKYFVLMSPLIYVGFVTLVLRPITILTRTLISSRELFCLISYGLFGHTLALLISNLSSELFIPSLLIFGGLSSVRVCCVLLFRTMKAPYRFVVCTPVTIIHWLYLLYLELKSSL